MVTNDKIIKKYMKRHWDKNQSTFNRWLIKILNEARANERAKYICDVCGKPLDFAHIKDSVEQERSRIKKELVEIGKLGRGKELTLIFTQKDWQAFWGNLLKKGSSKEE